MSDKLKNSIISIFFIAFIFFFFITGIITPDEKLSYSERRKLAEMPDNYDEIFNGEFFKDFDAYSLDQFPLRDKLRTVKSFSHFYIFNQKDNNDIFIINGNAMKLLYPLNERSIKAAAEKLNGIYEKYLTDMNVYFSIAPDKNFFAAQANGYPSIDYDKCTGIMLGNLINIKYINLYDCLSLDDFYRTDPHWRQDKLELVIKRLSETMGFEVKPFEVYQKKELKPFYGAYYGQSALPLNPDSLFYLTDPVIDSITAYDIVENKSFPVYDTRKFGKMDSYDVFLGGAIPIVEVTNENAATEKELILFRDSSGSSLAPLILSGYRKITLIDLRYIPSASLNKYIEFSDQDVLFLYNTAILNNSMMLK